jgi:hypothetical protein
MISFSSITDRNKTDYDTIDDWYITNTIIKEPTKSIQTRRIIKVGDNNDLLDVTDSSVDRVSDSILQFSRSVNPMVSVEYNNTNGQEAFLPYRVIKDGAFRPPLDFQYNKFPLSRLPRDVTSFQNYSCHTDFSKSKSSSIEQQKRVENNQLYVTSIFAPKQYCVNSKSSGTASDSNSIRTNVPIQITSAKNRSTGSSQNYSHINKQFNQTPVVSVNSTKTGNESLQTRPEYFNPKTPLQYNIITNPSVAQTKNTNTTELNLPEKLHYEMSTNKNTSSGTKDTTQRNTPLRPTRDTYSFQRTQSAIPRFAV